MAVKKTTSPTSKPAPSFEEIKQRAQEIYEDRVKKNLPGTQDSDWIEAEKQLAAKK